MITELRLKAKTRTELERELKLLNDVCECENIHALILDLIEGYVFPLNDFPELEATVYIDEPVNVRKPIIERDRRLIHRPRHLCLWKPQVFDINIQVIEDCYLIAYIRQEHFNA